MESIFFVGGIIILILYLNLRSRVGKLERAASGNVVQSVEKATEGKTVGVQATNASLFLYINQRIAAGASIEEIKTALRGGGWQAADIDAAFSSLATGTQSAVPSSAAIYEKDAGERFGEWLREDWLLKLGALLLLVGFGWLTTYAFLNNWIGPMGRISFGIIAGALFMALGGWRIRRFVHQGGIFLVVGSTVILLTVFAAREFYDFFTPVSALAVMFLSTAFVALASVKYNSRALALSSLILAGCAPLLTNASASNNVALFAYLFVVVLGAIWITVVTGRRELTAAALIMVAFYSVPHLSPYGLDSATLLLFAYAFTAVFFLTNTAGIVKLQGKEITPDLITAAGNGLFLLVWIMSVAPNEWKSLIISAWMIVFTVGAFLVFKITQRQEPFYVYAGVAVGLLAAATSAELSGATLTIAYTIESAAVAIAAYLIVREVQVAERLSWLLVVPMLLSFQSMTAYSWSQGVIHKDFFVLFVLAGTLMSLGIFFLTAKREGRVGDTAEQHATLLVLGSVFAYILIWLSLHAALQNDSTAVLLSLLIYMLIGLLSYFYGIATGKHSMRVYGGALIGAVVLRLFLVDVWNMEMTGRIITFFLLGALLMGTAFIGKKKKEEKLPA